MPDFRNWNANNGYSDLKSFNSYFGNSTYDLDYSFQDCTELESWNCATPAVYNMNYTFTGCTKLKHFHGDLRKLQSANGMFGDNSSNCSQLDIESVKHIAKSLPYGGYGYIHIGVSNTLNGSSELEEAIQQFRENNWDVQIIYSDFG